MRVVAAAAQEPAHDAELSRHLTTVRSQIGDLALDPNRRGELVLDMAATLDRAAQAASDPEARRRRWAEAIDLLDRFVRENPDVAAARQLRFQAAVFRWAQAQTALQAAVLEPADPRPRERAVTWLDDAIERLRGVSEEGDRTVLGENWRFRLAQALADRADLEPAGSPGRRQRERGALDCLQQPAAEPGLIGYWHLLKADLLRRVGEPAEAAKELDAAVKATPPPPDREVLPVRIPLLIDQQHFAEAIHALEGSHLEQPAKEFWMVRIQRAQLARPPEGADRFRIESELFRSVQALRQGKSPESRLALLELARSGLSPDAGQQPDAWDAMADAYQAAGDPAKAGAEAARAADRATALGQLSAAAGYRLRAGAFSFQAGQFLEADAVLSRVADDPAAGPLRARAGMLRALARGRALAVHAPGASTASYAEALQRQIRDFPRDPSTDEARWLLGGLALASSDRDQALALWSTIPPESSRWRDARLALAAMDREGLDRQLLNPDRPALTEQFRRADRFLVESLRQARSRSATSALELARARLNLTPIAGNAGIARDLCQRIARSAEADAIHYRARLLLLVASVEIGRYVEAEREAQTHVDWAITAERLALLDAIQLLDQCASTAATDLRQRRFGLVLKLIVEPLLATEDTFTPEQRFELRMRETRALLFIGSDRDARRLLATWKGAPATTDDRLLRDLGDTYSRLEAYSLETDVQRLRLQNNPAGSLPWFDARYALALAYYHTGQYKEAAQLIDATAILHPELGGGELQEKFIRLRQRLGAQP
jgi:tetratricopeptide (TPR) repeat protein